MHVSGNPVLIISRHPLFAEAITHVLASEGIAVVAVASSLSVAIPLLREHRPSTIIVDCEDPRRPKTEMLALLEDVNVEASVVFLSLDDNRMVVHQWRQLGDASSADLVSVLRNGASPSAGPGVSL